jgi:hypothetical protein
MPRRLSAFMGGTRRGRPVFSLGPALRPNSPRFFGGCGHFEPSLVRARALFIDARNSLPDFRVSVACTRFRRHRVRCFDGTGGGSWRDESLPASSSLRLCG